MKILEHGFCYLIRHMGSDIDIAKIARQSTKSKRENLGIIDNLIRNEHKTPFEFAVFWFHIKCPIDTARQIMRHRTASYNEKSGRYTEYNGEVHLFDYCDPTYTSETYYYYKGLISDKIVKKEEARRLLPLGSYTEFYMKIDLNNLMNFWHLRISDKAQPEIREYAIAMKTLISRTGYFNETLKAFNKYNDLRNIFKKCLNKKDTDKLFSLLEEFNNG